MRVLKDKVLVAITATTTDSLVAETRIRKGKIYITGSSQVDIGDEIIFGDNFEEIEINREIATRYYLMDEANIKIVFDLNSSEKKNVLPFLKKEK